jgi:NAD(P)-dependent dehydrogenase (short-subunit alcohol dehydrogenase family)
MPTILITGASRGLGLEFVRQYRADGWTVIATARDPAKIAVPGVEGHALEVTDFAAVDALAAALRGRAIDVLLNNAGINPPREAQGVTSMDYAAWSQTLTVNAVAPFKLLAAFLPHLLAGAAPRAITITSRMGSLTEMTGGSIAYRSSKAAVNAAMRGASLDPATAGVIVANYHPGWVRTDMGGPQAALNVPEAITSLRAAFARLTPADNGGFFNLDGSRIPW